jgi:hypothetical protein
MQREHESRAMMNLRLQTVRGARPLVFGIAIRKALSFDADRMNHFGGCLPMMILNTSPISFAHDPRGFDGC